MRDENASIVIVVVVVNETSLTLLCHINVLFVRYPGQHTSRPPQHLFRSVYLSFPSHSRPLQHCNLAVLPHSPVFIQEALRIRFIIHILPIIPFITKMSSSPDSSAGFTASYFATTYAIVLVCSKNLMSFASALIIGIGAFYRWVAMEWIQALPVLLVSTVYFSYWLKEQYEYDVAIFFAMSITDQIDVRVLLMVYNQELTSSKRLSDKMATYKHFSSSISCIDTSNYGNIMTI